MKILIDKFKTCLFVVAITIGLLSCEDFLHRPDQSAYTLADFFQNDEQLLQAANILYSSPWHDFSRGFINVGESMSGNHYSGGSSFWRLTLASSASNEILGDMSASLWAVNARANTTLENINMYSGSGTTLQGRNTAKGEVLVWKAMAYFYMVRIYGAVPIIHDNSELMASGAYNSLFRATLENVYDYIIMTLEQAIEWLPERNKSGRIDKYSAYGLLAKVHLTKSGLGRSGDRNQADLDKVREYAGKVVNESGRVLEPEFANIFRGSNNFTREALISWHWIALGNWTCANPLQADLAPDGFAEFSPWGGWNGPSLDLQAAFGESAYRLNNRMNTDKRRKATMMMYGDVYEYFWRDHPVRDKFGTDGAEKVNFSNGFDFTKFFRDVHGTFHSSTGANAVKHLAGNNADHVAEMGMPIANHAMSTGLATHILRLSDVYLVYAEAILGNAASTTDSEALRAYNAVRRRAGVAEKSSITFDDLFLERRLELAYEGDFWYDFVRLSYYKTDDALARLNAQERRNYSGINGYYMDGVEGRFTEDDEGRLSPRVNEEDPTGQPYSSIVFTVPFPITDLQMNPNLTKDPVDHDMNQYKYE